jgi:hypothetical protein
MVPHWLVQVFHPPHKFERPPFLNAWRYGIRKYGVEVTFNGMTSLLNFIKIYRLVQTLLGGGDTDRQTGDLISLTFLFKESRLIRTQITCVWKQNSQESICNFSRNDELISGQLGLLHNKRRSDLYRSPCVRIVKLAVKCKHTRVHDRHIEMHTAEPLVT